MEKRLVNIKSSCKNISVTEFAIYNDSVVFFYNDNRKRNYEG